MIAAIATIGEAEELPRLVRDLMDDGHVPLPYCNSENKGPHLQDVYTMGLISVDCPGLGLYAVWNMALHRLRDLHRPLAILNDDIVLGPGAVSKAALLMRDDPEVAICGLAYAQKHKWHGPPALRYVHGSYRHGGVNGCAFIVRPWLVGDFDESYEWWYGDDDMFLSAERDGHKLAIADGCWVQHRGEATSVNHPWTQEAKERDRKRFIRKWGDV